MDKQFDIFISYSSLDKKIADKLCSNLEAKGLHCWIAPRNINGKVGIEYSEAIIEGIQLSRVMIVLLTKNSNNSTAVLKEVERAVHYRLALLPVRLDDTALSKGLEFFLSSTHWLDARDKKYNTWFNELYQNCINIPGVLRRTEETLLPKDPASPKSPSSNPWGIIIFFVIMLAVIGAAMLAVNRAGNRENKKIIQTIIRFNDLEPNFEFIPGIQLLSDTSGFRRASFGQGTATDTLVNRGTYSEIWNNYDLRGLRNYYYNYLRMPYADKRRYDTINNFFMSSREITNKQWKAVMGKDAPEKRKNCYDCALEIPEADISEFVKKLNKKTGREFRLPSKAEMSYVKQLDVFEQSNNNKITPNDYRDGLGFRLCSDVRVWEDLPADRTFNNLHPIKVSLHTDTLKLKTDTAKYRSLGIMQ